MEPIEQVNEEFNSKKPKKKGLIITCIIAVIAIIALILTYFLYFAKPQRVFDASIDKLFNVKFKKFDSFKFNTGIKVSLEAEDDVYQEILKEINKTKLKIGFQMDSNEKKEILDMGLEYDKQSVVDAQLYYNDGELYAYFNELFDKYIEIEMEDEYKEQLESAFNSINKDNLDDSEKAIKIIGKEIKAQLNEYGEFEKSKESIKVGDKEEKLTKSTVTLKEKNLYKFLSTVCSNLANNDEFIECFNESPKDLLKDFSRELKEEQTNTKDSMTISIYTKGLTNKFMGIEVEVNIEDEDQIIIATLLKENKNTYSYKVATKEGKTKTDVIKSEINIEKDKESGTITINIEAPELGKAKIVLDYTIEYDKGVDKINTKNKVKIDELTEEDFQGILEKLQKRPLIGEFIENYFGNNTNYDDEITELEDDMLDLNDDSLDLYESDSALSESAY